MGGGGGGVKTFQLLCDLGEVYISSFQDFGNVPVSQQKERKRQSSYGDKGFCASEGKGEKAGNQGCHLEPCSAIFLRVNDLVHQKKAFL